MVGQSKMAEISPPVPVVYEESAYPAIHTALCAVMEAEQSKALQA